MDNFINLENVITALVVAVPTSFLSVYLALKKYRTEKWWDRKLVSYLETLADLNNLIQYCDAIIDIEYEKIEYSEKQLHSLKLKYYESKLRLRTQINIGQILYSKEAYKALLTFNSRFFVIENDNIDSRTCAIVRGYAEECVSMLEKYSKKDLGIK